MIKYTQRMLYKDAIEAARIVKELMWEVKEKHESIYAVPKGGFCFGVALSQLLGITMLSDESFIGRTTLIVDDVIDSGRTRDKFKHNDFICIHRKKGFRIVETEAYTAYVHAEVDDWIHYFWEGDNKSFSIEDAVIRQLQYIGEDVKREGLKDTPNRVVKAWDHVFSGYKQEPKDLITTFDAEEYNEIVLLKDIEMYSICEHHLLPFFGKAHIAYIPDKKVIGVSKLARIVDTYARRAQIQERIGNQVTELLMQELKPKAAACIIEAQHLCMLMRGVQKQNSVMVTSSLKGAFMKNKEAREELMLLVRG